jgi:hypothetical protein
MVFLEIVALLVVATVLITAIISIGRPTAEIMAQKTHFKFKGIDSEAESRLLKRIEGLEEELRQTKSQLSELKESYDFNSKIEDKKDSHNTSDSAQPVRIQENKQI